LGVIGDVLVGSLHLAHALAAAVWVGGMAMYLVASRATPAGLPGEVRLRFREVLRIGIAVFLLTGAFMTVQRLSSAPLPPLYFALLVAKVGLALWLFSVARGIGRDVQVSDHTWWNRSEGRVVLGGVVIYALAMALRLTYENTLRG
jgi:putative copper export protein